MTPVVSTHTAPRPDTSLRRDEVLSLLTDALLPDWAGLERLLDRIEDRMVWS